MAPILLSPRPAMGAPLLQKCRLCPLGARISPPKRTDAGSSESSREQSCPWLGANHVAVTEMLEKSVLRPSAHPRETWPRQARWKLSMETALFLVIPCTDHWLLFSKKCACSFSCSHPPPWCPFCSAHLMWQPPAPDQMWPSD